MKVLLVATDFPPTMGGIQTMMGGLAPEFSGWDLTVLAPEAPGAVPFDQAQPYRVVRSRRLRARPGAKAAFPGMAAKTLSLALSERPAVMLCAHPIDSLLGPLLRRALGIPYVVITHARELLSPRLRPLLPRLLGEASRVITNSRHTRSMVTALGIPAERVARVPLGYDPRRFADVRPSDLAERLDLVNGPWLLTVSRLADRYKGIDTMLRAMPAITRAVPEARYVVAGDGRLRPELERLSESLGCENRVQFLGRVSDADLVSLYRHCTASVLMSRDAPADGGVEGFGLVLLEANSFGKPVLGGNAGGIPDAVVDGETGLLADPCDPEDVARQAVRLLTDRALAERLGARGRERVYHERTWAACAAELQHIVEEALADRVACRVH